MNHSLLTLLIAIVLTSCNGQVSETKENNDLLSREFHIKNNFSRLYDLSVAKTKLLLFAQGKQDETSENKNKSSHLLCLDTTLTTIWEKHYGDNTKNEQFESFCIDTKGNIYLCGQILDSNSGLLLKLNPEGDIIWQKEFLNKGKFSSIKSFADSAIIITGAKTFTKTGLVKDSAFILKMDTEGNEIWKKSFCTDIGLRYVELVGSKIVLLVNTFDNSSTFPYSLIFCFDQTGDFLWKRSFDKNSTNIDFGIKAINLKTDNVDKINILVQSHNDVYINPHFIQLDTSGNKLLEVTFKKDSLIKNNPDNVYFYTSNIASNNTNELLVVKQDIVDRYYFSTIPLQINTDIRKNIESLKTVKLNNRSYTISNILTDVENRSVKWTITKSK